MTDDTQVATTEDRLLGGRLVLEQPKRGHRVGTDAVLLAAVADVRPGDRVLDVGSGVGAVGLALALREPAARVTLLEREPINAEIARRNVERNGAVDRVDVKEGDLFTLPAVAEATLVVSNPPFFVEGTVRSSTEPLRRRAHATETSHGAWLRAMLRHAAPRARVVLIHRPDALPDLLAAMDNRLGDIRIRAVHARADQPAIRILIGAKDGHRGPLGLLPPLVLHAAGGGFTEEADRLHQGYGASPLWPTRA